MTEPEQVDVVVVGLGVGGEEVAGKLAEAGLSVVGIELDLPGHPARRLSRRLVPVGAPGVHQPPRRVGLDHLALRVEAVALSADARRAVYLSIHRSWICWIGTG